MQIWTSYYAKMRLLYFDYAVVAISNSVPKWFPYDLETLPEVYPGWDLVMGIKNGNLTSDEYAKRYLKKLMDIDRNKVLDKLKSIHKKHNKDIVLVCYERPGGFCHRHILGKWLDVGVMELP